MTGPVEPISAGQFFFMVSVSVVAGGAYLWPQMVVQDAGVNGLYALITTTGVAMGLIGLQVWWAQRTQAEPYTGIVRVTWGVAGLWVIFPVGALFCLGMDATMLSLFGDMLRTFFYPMTPRAVMMGAMALAGVWIAVRPLSTVARNVQFWFPLVLLSVAFIIAFSVHNIRFPRAFVPSTTLIVPNWARASIATWFLYANGAVTMSLTPHVRWKHPHRAAWVAVAAIFVQGAILLVLFVVTMDTLGPNAVTRLHWPIIYVFSLINIRTFFLKGVGSFVIITWTTAMVLYLAVHLYCLGWNVQSMTTGPSRGRWWITVLGAGAVWLGAVSIPSDMAARWLLFHLLNPLDLAWTVFVVPASLVIVAIRYGKKRRVSP